MRLPESAATRCRKELPCGREGDDCRVVNMLRDWICSANTFGDRLSHMRSVRRARDCEAQPSKLGKPRSPSGRAGAGSCSLASTSHGADPPPSAPRPDCWISAGPHEAEQCFLLAKALMGSLQSADRPNLVRGRDATWSCELCPRMEIDSSTRCNVSSVGTWPLAGRRCCGKICLETTTARLCGNGS